MHWNHVPVLAQVHKGHRGNMCPGSPSSNTNNICSYFFFYHDKSNSNKYSLQTVNRKLFQSRVSEQKLTLLWERLWNLLPWFRMFCTLSKALNPKIIKSFYFRQAVLIPLNCGQEWNDLKILSNLCFWFHFQHNDERKPTTSVWYLQRVTVQYVFGSVCCV